MLSKVKVKETDALTKVQSISESLALKRQASGKKPSVLLTDSLKLQLLDGKDFLNRFCTKGTFSLEEAKSATTLI